MKKWWAKRMTSPLAEATIPRSRRATSTAWESEPTRKAVVGAFRRTSWGLAMSKPLRRPPSRLCSESRSVQAWMAGVPISLMIAMRARAL